MAKHTFKKTITFLTKQGCNEAQIAQFFGISERELKNKIMKTEILENNILIAEFMKLQKWTNPFERRTRCYDASTLHKNFDIVPAKDLGFAYSWDWLIPACYKWDNLYLEKNFTLPDYEELCDLLDSVITGYEIEPVYNQIIHNIKMYNIYKKAHENS
jgi:hypothetical protein